MLLFSIQPLTGSLTSPMVLAFLLGIIATLIKSDLKFPEGMYLGLTIFLLFAIGLKGGYKLSHTHLSDFWKPALGAVLVCVSFPLLSYFILKRILGFDAINAAAIAAHVGSVSVVTFSQTLVMLDKMQITYEGYMPAILAIMEVPGILVALYLAQRNASLPKEERNSVLHELLTNKGMVLLIGGILIGLATGDDGYHQVEPLYDGMFKGILCLFLLEVGLVTGRRLFDLKKVGPKLLLYGLLIPIIHAGIGIMVAHAAGLSIGGATAFATLCASASYIAAPAAVRIALPEANPTYYLTVALVIIFPFNLTVGISLYYKLAQYIYAIW